jgi:hypothetical protein
MHIILSTLQGDTIARIRVRTDKNGYLHATHPTFQFEVDCALYGYQDGGVSSDTIDDDDTPYMRWSIQ